ncbi:MULTISPECIES: dTMP kinase [Streptomyces]|uniref:dTMP kinase n=1 Tax=Streptomyces TaxID=1883 RepID=UPI001F08B3AF|nr:MULTISPECIES: thymidylate kinase [Streptomyces]MDX3065352.1 thymidylate kinase [Streptomyces sp. ND04-05B]MDX3519551.1 thymidylate kinase [Streptomyces scabiei]
MTTTRVPRPRRDWEAPGRPLWVSVEGINGVGKTTAVRAVTASLGSRCLRLDELTDQAADTLPGLVIAALAAGGDVCLRTGHPVVETLALLALKFREFERLTPDLLAGVDVILEDRGVDSVAVCQGAILHDEHLATPARAVAEQILATARRWRSMPDATLLLTGELEVCVARFAARIGRTLPASALEVIKQTDHLYRELAAAEPNRFTVIDVAGHGPEETGKAVEDAVLALVAQLEVSRAS